MHINFILKLHFIKDFIIKKEIYVGLMLYELLLKIMIIGMII